MELERHRVGLTAYCYRVLGSGFEAEDAVQETFLRAWRGLDRFDAARGSLGTWLHAIATNVCLDMLRSPQRRAVAVDMGAPARLGDSIGEPLPEGRWVWPVPDRRVVVDEGDPAEVVAQRQSVRLAFVAALQVLAPRQRVVLILRDVLAWRAEEVAGLLGTSVAGVNSALQRARAALGARGLGAAGVGGVGVAGGANRTGGASGVGGALGVGGVGEPDEVAQRRLLDAYCEAFERYDVEALVALLHEDATMSMPPFTWWLRGRDAIRVALEHSDGTCLDARLVPTRANGAPAFGQYVSTPVGHRPFALVTFDFAGDRIAGVTTHLDPERLFPLFELPMSPPSPSRTTR